MERRMRGNSLEAKCKSVFCADRMELQQGGREFACHSERSGYNTPRQRVKARCIPKWHAISAV
jgi:hypothetical protein